VVALQIGYAIADMTAKAGFGVLIYLIARAKSTKTASGDAYADRRGCSLEETVMTCTRPR